jgi:rhodanese-related sulfurtransferase
MLCLPMKPWAEDAGLVEALEEFLEFAEYSEGAVTPDQLSSLGLQAFYLVDTRLKEQFAQRHIPGAIHIEWRQILAQREQLPRDKTVLLYCDTGLLSSKAHFALRLLGRDNVKVLYGGFNSWRTQQGLERSDW